MMPTRQRNRLLHWLFFGAWTCAGAALLWVLGSADEWRSVRFWLVAAGLLTLAVYSFVGMWGSQSDLDAIEEDLRKAGVEIPDEEPVRIQLAESRESLVVSIIALVLIAAVFVAYWAGWFERVGLLKR